MPADTAVTAPVPEPTVATDVVPEVHVPPPVALLNVVMVPAQADNVPVIVPAGELSTVIVRVAMHDPTAVV